MASGKSSGARRLAQSVNAGLDAEVPPEVQGYGDANAAPANDGDAEGQPGFMLEDLCRWDGNLAELFHDSEDGKKKLQEIGSTVIREYRLDKAARKDWEESAKSALEAAGQKKGEEKAYPFKKAANVKYPLLTTAAIQFAARAYPNIVRGDEVVAVKVNGDDADSVKAERSDRVASWSNDQLIYQCPEWEIGTDQLLHQLPITGAGFRKVYWDTSLNRPRFDYAPALKVIIPIDAPSLELSPRVTQELDAIYPHDYESKVANGVWLKCAIRNDTQDTQKPIKFIEQCRYIDMDEDGLSEPYIVVVHEDTSEVVRIDPAFDLEDIKRAQADPQDPNAQPGRIIAIDRLLPWVEYTFLPDPEGGAYGIGFGKLLEAISETVNTLLNQMIDAGHLANTNTGFIGAGFKTRGGTITLEPNAFKMLEGVQDVSAAIQRLQFPGPNAVSFQLVDMLLGAAKDITAIKDVLAGDMPGGQHVAEGTVMALIEQGLQVFTSIYKRIYRSMRKEFELQCKLNARYLDPAEYQKFLDQRPKPVQAQNAPPAPPMDPRLGIGGNNGPPMLPEDMGPAPAISAPTDSGMPAPMDATGGLQQQMPQAQPMPGAGGPQAPTGPQGPGAPGMIPMPPQMAPMADPARDFDLSDLDIRPVADPTAITDMQRMAKAQFKLGFLNDPAINRIAVLKSVWRDARITNPEQYIVENNPVQAQVQQIDIAQKQADVDDTKADTQLKLAQAAEIGGKMQAASQSGATENDIKQRQLSQRDRELDQADQQHALDAQRHALERYHADIEAANKEVELMMEAANQQHSRTVDHANLDIARQNVQVSREAARAKMANGAGNGSNGGAVVHLDAKAEVSKAAESVGKMAAANNEAMAKALDHVARALEKMAKGDDANAEAFNKLARSIDKSNKIAMAPTELERGPDGRAKRSPVRQLIAAIPTSPMKSPTAMATLREAKR